MAVMETYAAYRAFKILVQVLRALGPILKESILRDRTLALFIKENQVSIFMTGVFLLTIMYVIYLKETRPLTVDVLVHPLVTNEVEITHPVSEPQNGNHNDPTDNNDDHPPVILRPASRTGSETIHNKLRERFTKKQ